MRVATARDAADLLGPLVAGESDEALAVAWLDPARGLIDTMVLRGCLDTVDLPIRTIMKRALLIDAYGLVVAHNHPSGDPSPSEMDIAMTRRLAATGAAVEVRLHDHLIFAGGQVRSMRGLGLL